MFSYRTVLRVQINDLRIAILFRFLQSLVALYIVCGVILTDQFLDVQDLSGVASIHVSDLTDWNFTSRDHRPCNEVITSVPWNSAPNFTALRNQYLPGKPDLGYTRQSPPSLVIHTFVESDEPKELPCGLQGPSCYEEPTPFNSTPSYSYGKCVLDWERYVFMISHDMPDIELAGAGHAERFLKTKTTTHFQAKLRRKGKPLLEEETVLVPIFQSDGSSWYDWRDEGLPLVRTNLPFRSNFHKFDYFSMECLLIAAGLHPDISIAKGVALRVQVAYSNVVPSLFHPYPSYEYLVSVSVENEEFFSRNTLFVGNEFITSWSHGVQISVHCAGTFRSFSFWKLLTTIASSVVLLSLCNSLIDAWLMDIVCLRALATKMGSAFKLSCHRKSCFYGYAPSWSRSLIVHDVPRFSENHQRIWITGPAGITVDFHSCVVTRIPADSPLFTWNAEHPDVSVEEGDVILQVNGISKHAPELMLRQLANHGEIDMTIFRHSGFKYWLKLKGKEAHGDEGSSIDDPDEDVIQPLSARYVAREYSHRASSGSSSESS